MGVDEKLAGLANRLFSEKYLNYLGRRLESTKIRISADTFMGLSFLLGLSSGAAVSVISLILGIWILAPAGVAAAIGVFLILSRGLPLFLAQRRASELERVLPDALRQMASALRAGMGTEAALDDISKSKYGELSTEFERVITEIHRGRSLTGALNALSRRSYSPLYHRAFHLIVEGIEHGAALASVLDSVSSDIREVQAIQRERKSATTQQVLFLYAVALFAAPFIVGLTVGVGGISAGGRTMGLPEEMISIAMIYNGIQAFICGLIVGVIKYGRMSRGLSYTVPFVVVATMVFVVARFIIGSMAPVGV